MCVLISPYTLLSRFAYQVPGYDGSDLYPIPGGGVFVPG